MRLINADGRDLTAQTISDFRKIIGGAGLTEADLRKAAGTVTLANGLVAYDLEAPAKNLYPVLTPLRNRMPRSTKGSGAGTGPNWKVVTKIAGQSAMPVMPWVPEGQRSGRMQITTEDKSATYKTIGLETDVTFEAQSAGAGFEDVLSSSGTRLLQQTMILEEYALLGGNSSVDLAKPVVTAGVVAGGSIAAATYNVYCVALTFEGVLASSVADGIKREATITGMDGKTYKLNGGSSAVSDVKTATTAAANLSIKASCPVVKGAHGYAWYVGANGAEKLEAITYQNSVLLTSLLGTGAAFSDITDAATNRSKNALAFDGLLYSAYGAGTGYYKAMATGTEGTGTALTASGHGTIVEIDEMLRWYWDTYRLSPDEIYVSSQELSDISTKVLQGANAAPLVRFVLDVNQQNPTLVAGQVVGYYFNPFSMNGGQVIPIRLHPNLTPGTLFSWCQDLPAYYQSANVPQVAEVQCRRDYYQIPWPIITRANETGVYAEEVLKVYAPFAIGIITNIGKG